MQKLYNEVSQSVEELFNNPITLQSIEDIEKDVNALVDRILKDDFKLSIFISTLAHEYFLHTHSLNVTVYSICLGKHLKMDLKGLQVLGLSAILHDIGKTKIDSKILQKAGKLTDAEFEEVKRHPKYSWNILTKVGMTNKALLAGVRSHNEKMDGSGYPDKLRSSEIHQYAKIIGLCDVFDALTTKRSYKDPTDTFNTILTMKKDMKSHIDSNLINQFILMFKNENDIA
jgi:HD-GYP domain-containing protein (c-di-GMP phosphodiesterase class II)